MTRWSFSEGSFLAGSNGSAVIGAALAALLPVPVSAGAETTPDAGARTGAISVGIPEGVSSDVSFTFGDGKVSIALPAGSVFPLDFARESNGLLRGGEVVTVDDAHVRLDLKLAGIVDGI